MMNRDAGASVQRKEINFPFASELLRDDGRAVVGDPEEMALDVLGDPRVVLGHRIEAADVPGSVRVLPLRLHFPVRPGVFAQTSVRPGPFARIEDRDVMMLFTFSCRRAYYQLGSVDLKHSADLSNGAR